MQITPLLKYSFWHSDNLGSIQVLSVDVDKNELTYITIESISHTYDRSRVQTTESLDLIESKWTLSDYDQDRVEHGVEIPDPEKFRNEA